jgi:hypothetical protein
MHRSTKTQEIKAIRVTVNRSRSRILSPGKVVWQSRYAGCVAVAYVSGKAIAGISGPWSGKYALTCWERPMPARRLELFDSLEAAKHEVEQRINQTSSGHLMTLLRTLQRNSASVARALLLHRNRNRSLHRSPREVVMQSRQLRLRQDTDLSGMYFHAFE